MKRYVIAASAALLTATGVMAHSVAFSENFDGDYTVNFPVRVGLNSNVSIKNFQTLFMDGNGVTQPWWHLRDSNAATDRFIGSHSAYTPAGTANNWLVTRAIEIPTEGYNLTFDAQSCLLRADYKTVNRLSDLWVYISETPFDNENLPTEPVEHYVDIPYGKYLSDNENDFQNYSINLDSYAGKTIYIYFANLNTDRDILLLDNILVQRLDKASVSLSAPEWTVDGEFEVEATVSCTSDGGLSSWKLTFTDGNGKEETVDGGPLDFEMSETVKFKSSVKADGKTEYTASLKVADSEPIIAEGVTKGMAFMPNHRVLMEESTGLWCGNCPLGIFTMENLLADETMKDMVVPVNVHIPGSKPDYMYPPVGEYAGMLALEVAPMVRLDRDPSPIGYSNVDASYDPSNDKTMAGRIRLEHEKVTFADIALTADLQIQGNDTTAVNCTVEVTPAITLKGNYKIGFILVENNVGLDDNRYWCQENYYSGTGLMGVWSDLPGSLYSFRYHDVARGIWGYRGLEGSLPSQLDMCKAVKFSKTLEIPDTYEELESGAQKVVVSPSVKVGDCIVVAYLFDGDANRVLNTVAVPLSEQAEDRYTAAEYAEKYGYVGIENVIDGDDSDAEPVYYNLQGQRVENPGRGIYIMRKGSKTEKITL